MLPAELADVALYGSIPRFGDLCIHAVIDLRRAFSRKALERAVAAAIEAFPVLGRRYEPRFWRDVWRLVDGPISDAVHVVSEPADLEAETRAWVLRPIAHAHARPLRLVSLQHGDRSRLVVSILHLAVDGAGAAAVGHVLGASLYAQPPALPVGARRDLASVLERVRWFHLPQLARDAAGIVAQSVRTVAAGKRERAYPRSRSGHAGGAGVDEPSWRHLVVSAADAERIKARCAARGASLNDALVAALARVAAARSSGDAVSVIYTMDLRRYRRAPRLSAANTSSILSVTVPRRAMGDLASTAAAVAESTKGHKRGMTGPALLLGAAALTTGAPHGLLRRLIPRLHSALVDLPLSRGLLVTNVGRLDEGLAAFGDDLESVRLIGPNIRGADVPAVVACGFRGELQLELYAPPGVAPAALEELEAELRVALEIG
jgi:NRPS condensation-like uncharacterized protein